MNCTYSANSETADIDAAASAAIDLRATKSKPYLAYTEWFVTELVHARDFVAMSGALHIIVNPLKLYVASKHRSQSRIVISQLVMSFGICDACLPNPCTLCVERAG